MSSNPWNNGGASQAPQGDSGGGGWGGPSSAWGPPVQSSYAPRYELEIDEESPMHQNPPASSTGAWGSNPSAFTSVPLAGTVPAIVPSNSPQLAFTSSTTAPVARGTMAPMQGAQDNGSFGAAQPLLNGQSPSAEAPTKRKETAEDYAKYAFYNVRKYRPYFDVDTKEVGWRVLSSFIGAFKPDFMDKTQEHPDLYGPFWVATTLIFVTAASGNLSSYIAYESSISKSSSGNSTSPSSTPSAPTGQWFADTTKLASSAGLFYGYVFVISLILWFWIKYLKGSVQLVNMFCVYGYALTIFIPVSIICAFPISWLRWLAVAVGTFLSGGFLVMNMRRTTLNAEPPVSLIKSIWLLGFVMALHIGLGLGIRLYFFSY